MNNKNYLNEESDLLSSIKNWNIRFPFDLKWRRKYKIPFGSKAHRKMSLLDIKFDIEEDNMIQKIIAETAIEKKNKELGKNDKQLLKERANKKITKEEIDNAFENLDLSAFNNMKI